VITSLQTARELNCDVRSLSGQPSAGEFGMTLIGGYTVGATADYEDRNWGFRFAEALMPKVANGIDLVYRPWQVHSENWEYELRRGFIPRKPGAVRLLAYTNYANMRIYRDAILQFDEHLVPRPEITNHPWHITRKYGFGINLDQHLTPNLAAFGRFGWNNGRRSRLLTPRSIRLLSAVWAHMAPCGVAARTAPG
jgi:hypothetical protein